MTEFSTGTNREKSLKRVSDNEIIQAIWKQMVRGTARDCLNHYVGGRWGIRPSTNRGYAQDIHIIDRECLDVPLSKGHLRKRLVSLIESGKAAWVVPRCTFWVDSDHAREVFDYACAWWARHGVPSGFCQERRAMRCVEVTGFDQLAQQLEEELLERFGDALATYGIDTRAEA